METTQKTRSPSDSQKIVQKLHKELLEGVKRGEFYGVDQKIKILQRSISISTRI
ncbi:MAG: hypothetical protein HQM15_01025 [Deltaproteobacteria bacterium]|nr:hypothetical protein [Deltaproteobacteria bacterium]